MGEDEDKTKRRWQRFDVEFRAKVVVARKGEEHQFSGTVSDISEGGTRLFVVGELQVGETVRLELALPYSGRLAITGVVRNRTSFEYGVQFSGLSSADRDSLVRNCRALLLLE
jgi:c-di-GMP-binding flagellar brake protein YcgR